MALALFLFCRKTREWLTAKGTHFITSLTHGVNLPIKFLPTLKPVLTDWEVRGWEKQKSHDRCDAVQNASTACVSLETEMWPGPADLGPPQQQLVVMASFLMPVRRRWREGRGHSLEERFCSLQAYLWTSWNTLFWADQRLLSFLCFPVVPGRQPPWSDTAVTHAQPPHSLILQSLPLWFPWGKNWSPLLCYFNSFSEEGITAPPGRGMEAKIRWGWWLIAALIHRTAACMLQAAFLHTSLLTNHNWLTVIILWQRDSITTAEIQLLPPLSLVEDIVI